MDDNSHVMKHIEIVQRDDYSNVTDIKCEPLSVKVGVVTSFYFIWLIYMHILLEFYFICYSLIIIVIQFLKFHHFKCAGSRSCNCYLYAWQNRNVFSWLS